MKNTNCKESNYCGKCFCNPCTCNSYSNQCDCCDDIADIQTSLESILDSEANISECASKLFSCIFPCELDTIEDAQKKINLFSTLLLSYSNRACSLSKLIDSVNSLDESYIPNPHIDIFDTPCSIKPSISAKPIKDFCTRPIPNTQQCCIDDLNPPKVYNSTCENTTYAQHICNGIYFLEKIKIYFSKYNCSRIFEVYLNSKNQKLLYTNAKNSCNITKTYIV
ncbi:MAG: hypothetical protein ACRCTZ_01015 [Sarcina sp.]